MNIRRETLLLHVCCAPCSIPAIDRLAPFFKIKAFFYNPNIHPEEEYRLRLREFLRYAALKKLQAEEAPPYRPGEWFEAVRGTETEPEGGGRCAICFQLRLEETARRAKKLGIENIASTLTSGPGKKAVLINKTGKAAAARHGIKFHEADFKKKEGFKSAVLVSKELKIYRQRYCGCLYSLKTRPVF